MYPIIGLDRPVGLQEVEVPWISRHSAHEGVKPYAPAVFTPPRKYSLHSFLLDSESTPGPLCGREDYVNENFPLTPSEIETATCRLVTQWCYMYYFTTTAKVWGSDSRVARDSGLLWCEAKATSSSLGTTILCEFRLASIHSHLSPILNLRLFPELLWHHPPS